MDNVYVFEGKTSTEAIENGLKELKVSKNQVDIKILDNEDKRSFFSILTPRVVKVEMRLKNESEVVKKENNKSSKTHKISEVDMEEVKKNVDKFLKEFIDKLPNRNLKYEIKEEESTIKVEIDGEDTGYLIGYRGNVLNSLQVILNNIANNELNERARVLLNIGGYKEKREKDLKDLADKIAGTVIKKRKSITLEPMTSYERKIIHSKLQENSKVETHSIGEEPNRKIVVSLKK